MAFGNSVTSYDQQSVGIYGYTIKIDVTALLFVDVQDVQAQASSSDTPEPATAEVSRTVIQGYLNDSGCPDLAFNYSNGELIVFFKTSVFAYVSTTRVASFGLRKPQACTSDSDYIDVPEKDHPLLINYALELAYNLKGKVAPERITDEIDNFEQVITDE